MECHTTEVTVLPVHGSLSIWAITTVIYMLLIDLFTPDYIFNAVQYLLGMHPGRNQAAFVTGLVPKR